jgi:hypothetical protein
MSYSLGNCVHGCVRFAFLQRRVPNIDECYRAPVPPSPSEDKVGDESACGTVEALWFQLSYASSRYPSYESQRHDRDVESEV